MYAYLLNEAGPEEAWKLDKKKKQNCYLNSID